MNRLFFEKYRQWPLVATFITLGLLCLAYIALAETLTVTIVGSGSVNSEPAGIACTNGNSSGCSASFANMSGITLAATPAWNSNAGVFSGACSGTGSCFFNISTNTAVTAKFDPNNQSAVIVAHPQITPEYSTLAEAYANISDNGYFAAHIYTFKENLMLYREVSVTFYGGMGEMYLSNYGNTTLQGSLEVQKGSIVVDSLIIE